MQCMISLLGSDPRQFVIGHDYEGERRDASCPMNRCRATGIAGLDRLIIELLQHLA